jgi:hypothetical protein
VIDVTKLPPPGASGRGLPPAKGEPDGDEYGNDEDRAAEVSQCQDVLDAIKGGDAEAACDALKRFIETVTGPSKL